MSRVMRFLTVGLLCGLLMGAPGAASAAGRLEGATPTISAVHFSNIGPNLRIEVDGAGFGLPTVAMPYVGEVPNFLFTDVTHNWSFGQPGQGNLQYTSWTDTRIVVNGFGSSFKASDILAAGDTIAIEVQNTKSTEFTIWTGMLRAGVSPAPDFGGPTPVITGVRFSNIGPNMRIEVDGGGFGSPAVTMPYVGEVSNFLFTDVTHNWSFGQPGQGNLQYTSWTDTRVVINGFGTSFNASYALAAGDSVAIQVQNAKSTEFAIWTGTLSTSAPPAPTSTPRPRGTSVPARKTPAPPAPACKVVTVATFDTCVEPSVLRVVKALPGGIVEQGSAFVIRSDASGTYLATNQHVIDGAGKDALTVYLPDGHTRYSVTAVLSTGGTDGTTQDLALIELQPTGLRPLPWGDSSKVHSLQEVVAVGYGDAFDLLGPPSITQGSVSATGRDLGKCGGGGWIQHDAPLSHGNSGGPLLDQQGQVVGINTLKFDDQSACPSLSGFGFAIPITSARATLGTLARLLPGVQGGLIGAIGSRDEIAARSIPSKPAALPHLRFQVPLTWHKGSGASQFSSRDGRVIMMLAAKSYRLVPTPARLQADALHALGQSGPFTGVGVGPLSIDGFVGLVVTVLPARHRYRGDGMALVDSGQNVEVMVVRLVDPGATSRDRQEADALLLSLVAVR